MGSEAMSATATLDKASAMERIRACMAEEAESGRLPVDRSEVPLSAEYFTREWLTSVLCAGVGGAEVKAFELLGEANLGTTARRNVAVHYNAAGEAAGLPQRIFAKATPEFDSRYICGLSGAIAHEANFYNRIAPLVSIEAPRCYHADYDPPSFRSIFLFEDAGVTKGARFLDGGFRVQRHDMEAMLRTIAGLHSRFWGDPILDTHFTWLKDPYSYQLHINDLIGFRERTQLGLERSLNILPPGLRARHGELWDAMIKACRLRAEAPRTLLHADDHLGNWYVTDKGAMGLCDWQCTVKGGWASDFAYAVTSSLEPAERRAWEKDLLAFYLDALELPPGQARPAFEDAWLDYRRQTLHGLYNWLFVAGIGEAATLMHSGTITTNNLRRMTVAVDELDTLDALAEA